MAVPERRFANKVRFRNFGGLTAIVLTLLVYNQSTWARSPKVPAIDANLCEIMISATTADGVINTDDWVEIDGEIDPPHVTGTIYFEIQNPDSTTYQGDIAVNGDGTFHLDYWAQEGATHIFAEYSDDDYVCTSHINVQADDPNGMAIIVAGGGVTGNPLWNATEVLCDQAYNVLVGRSIAENRIAYLHPDPAHDPDGDGTSETFADTTKVNFQNAIESWAADLSDVSTPFAPALTPLTLYIMAPEVSAGVIQLNETEVVSVAELEQWLEAFEFNSVEGAVGQPPTVFPVNIILEFSQSGFFIKSLGKPGRIIVTSTGDLSTGYPGQSVSPDGCVAFSRFFFDGINQGRYIETAWATGFQQMIFESYYSQWPLIEANGNGVPNEITDQISGDGAGDKRLQSRKQNFIGASATRLDDGNIEIAWSANFGIADAVGVNIYKSLSLNENYVKLNVASLPLDSVFLDTAPYFGVNNFYWFELVKEDGSTDRDYLSKISLEPEEINRDFFLVVQEATIASVPGNTSVYDIEVLSQKGYTGAVDLGAGGLPPEAIAAVFDPPSVDVPGHSTLTVMWDPLLEPPTGGYSYPFEITATESGGLSLTTKTVDVLGIVISPDDHYLTQFVYPTEPEAGHEAEVFGRLTPNEASQTVTVITGSPLDVFTATTDDSGLFSLTVPVDMAGEIQFTSAVSDATSALYVTDAKRGRRYIRMTATTADGLIDPGDLVELDGEIRPNPGPGVVHVEISNPPPYRLPPGYHPTFAFNGDVSVDQYGAFHQSYYALEGVTYVEAEYGSDANYYNCSASLGVPANAPIGMVIVVAADCANESGSLWNGIQALTDKAYNVYKGRLIPESRIRYLHPDPTRDPRRRRCV